MIEEQLFISKNVGKRFNFHVIQEGFLDKNQKPKYRTLCVCGTMFVIPIEAAPKRLSCGCANTPKLREAARHAHKFLPVARQFDTNGYISTYADFFSNEIVLEHRKIVENLIGRPLLSEETVHHKNGQKKDNRPSNLELWAGGHPAGQRASDLVKYAIEILMRYAPDLLAQATPDIIEPEALAQELPRFRPIPIDDLSNDLAF